MESPIFAALTLRGTRKCLRNYGYAKEIGVEIQA